MQRWGATLKLIHSKRLTTPAVIDKAALGLLACESWPKLLGCFPAWRYGSRVCLFL
jgi:hypothetical protein